MLLSFIKNNMNLLGIALMHSILQGNWKKEELSNYFTSSHVFMFLIVEMMKEEKFKSIFWISKFMFYCYRIFCERT